MWRRLRAYAPIVGLVVVLPSCDLNIVRDLTPPPIVLTTCSQMVASEFFWNLSGLGTEEIIRSQGELTAVIHLGQSKTLRVSAGSTFTAAGEDCRGKATSVEWMVTNPSVARLEVGQDLHTATLTGLVPGDTGVFANLAFQDGTLPRRALPYVISNVGSGNVTIVRFVP